MYRGNLGGKFSETKWKKMKISTANLKSSMADRTCTRHQKANMKNTKEKQDEWSEGQVGQYSMEETCGSWFWLVPWEGWLWGGHDDARSAAFKTCLNKDKDKKIDKKEENKLEEEEVCNIPLENSLTCGVGLRRIPQRPSHTLAAPSLQTFKKEIRKIKIRIKCKTRNDLP